MVKGRHYNQVSCPFEISLKWLALRVMHMGGYRGFKDGRLICESTHASEFAGNCNGQRLGHGSHYFAVRLADLLLTSAPSINSPHVCWRAAVDVIRDAAGP